MLRRILDGIYGVNQPFEQTSKGDTGIGSGRDDGAMFAIGRSIVTISASGLITMIDGAREGNLSSAIRLFVLQHVRNEDKRMPA